MRLRFEYADRDRVDDAVWSDRKIYNLASFFFIGRDEHWVVDVFSGLDDPVLLLALAFCIRACFDPGFTL